MALRVKASKNKASKSRNGFDLIIVITVFAFIAAAIVAATGKLGLCLIRN